VDVAQAENAERNAAGEVALAVGAGRQLERGAAQIRDREAAGPAGVHRGAQVAEPRLALARQELDGESVTPPHLVAEAGSVVDRAQGGARDRDDRAARVEGSQVAQEAPHRGQSAGDRGGAQALAVHLGGEAHGLRPRGTGNERRPRAVHDRLEHRQVERDEAEVQDGQPHDGRMVGR
jgi:hypothetical protein